MSDDSGEKAMERAMIEIVLFCSVVIIAVVGGIGWIIWKLWHG